MLSTKVGERARDLIEITHGKTANAQRRVPLSQRAAAILALRRLEFQGDWVFPAPTRSGHIEPSTLRGQHARACTIANVAHFPLYTFRHTCLTRWAPFMDPWTLAYLAGHRDMSIHEAVRSPAGVQHARRDREGPGSLEWAQFWAQPDSEHHFANRKYRTK